MLKVNRVGYRRAKILFMLVSLVLLSSSSEVAPSQFILLLPSICNEMVSFDCFNGKSAIVTGAGRGKSS